MLNNYIVANYVENFINDIIIEKININFNNNTYIIYLNKKEICSFHAFNFWREDSKDLYNIFNYKKMKLKEDVVGTIFFFLSGYWEYINNFPMDKYGRISVKRSFQYKYNLVEIPIVDLLLKDFIEVNNLHYKYRTARYFLTHDIDKLFYKVTIKSLFGDIIKRKDLIYFLRNLKILLLKKNPFSVYKLLNLNNKYNVFSNYYFLLGKQDESSGYELQENIKELEKIKKILKKTGQNIGLHYSFNYLFTNDLSKRGKELLNFFNIDKLTGRAHYLNFDIKKSFQVYEKAKIKIDCTGGYHDAIGFRFGTSFPFRPFNFKKNENYDLIEIPLTIMDCTPFDYMNLNIEDGEKRIFELIERIIDVNGVICILWHNSSFWTKQWRTKEKIYLKILEKIQNYKPYNINCE